MFVVWSYKPSVRRRIGGGDQLGADVREGPGRTPCFELAPTADHLGTGFLLVKSDVGGNIDRLAARASTNPSKYSENVYAIVLDEVEAGDQAGSSSCTKGLLWLTRWVDRLRIMLEFGQTHGLQWGGWRGVGIAIFDEVQATKLPFRLTSSRRAMIFVVGLLQRLLDHPEETLSAAASEAYYATLQKYHGWIVTGTFTVALKIVPSRCAPWGSLMGPGFLTHHVERMRQQ